MLPLRQTLTGESHASHAPLIARADSTTVTTTISIADDEPGIHHVLEYSLIQTVCGARYALHIAEGS